MNKKILLWICVQRKLILLEDSQSQNLLYPTIHPVLRSVQEGKCCPGTNHQIFPLPRQVYLCQVIQTIWWALLGVVSPGLATRKRSRGGPWDWTPVSRAKPTRTGAGSWTCSPWKGAGSCMTWYLQNHSWVWWREIFNLVFPGRRQHATSIAIFKRQVRDLIKTTIWCQGPATEWNYCSPVEIAAGPHRHRREIRLQLSQQGRWRLQLQLVI